MPMNNRILRPLARPLLLDAVPGAAAAYSLRQLSNAYTGPVVTVRRSSDNAEADFKASEIDDGTLAAFCGAGDGLVKTWHDQSGNGRDAINTTSANQPKIVGSGSLVTESGKPALEFDGANDYFSVSSPVAVGQSANGALAAFLLYNATDLSLNRWVYQAGTGAGSGDTDHGVLLEPSLGVRIFGIGSSSGTGWLPSVGNSSIGQELFSGLFIAATATTGKKLGAIDGALLLDGSYNTKAGSATLMNIGINTVATGSFFVGTMQELVFYTSDQTANRQRIEGDINRHFGIF